MSDCGIAAQVFLENERATQLDRHTEETVFGISKEQLTLSMRQTVERIDCHEIYFMESRGHNVYIYTKNREIRIYQKLTDLSHRLPRYFHQCHKSYIVNLEHVTRFEKTLLYMADGRIVPVSRTHQAETKAVYSIYGNA